MEGVGGRLVLKRGVSWNGKGKNKRKIPGRHRRRVWMERPFRSTAAKQEDFLQDGVNKKGKFSQEKGDWKAKLKGEAFIRLEFGKGYVDKSIPQAVYEEDDSRKPPIVHQ